MITKDQLFDSLKNLPDKFSFDELLDRIILLQKIDTGVKQSKAGKTYSSKEAKEKLDKWLK